jgi:nitroimidazol reductase NimA-like FMN-containing flavoprotein (pyridoxamine 5'-phosphate oxidase superfamily)
MSTPCSMPRRCAMGYVIDGEPYVTPTVHWRQGNRLFWHRFLGQPLPAADRAAARMPDGQPDGWLCPGASAYNHSVNYRSAMVFGRAQRITDAQRARPRCAMVDSLFPAAGTRCAR